MSEEKVKKDIGQADQLTMDDFVRTLIATMFENDNDTAHLTAVLGPSDSQDAPRVELELRLTAINGKPTQGEASDV